MMKRLLNAVTDAISGLLLLAVFLIATMELVRISTVIIILLVLIIIFDHCKN